MVQFPNTRIEEIGISFPAPINPASRQISLGPGLYWNVQDLQNKLESATQLAVCVETIANACALAEMWFNPRVRSSRDFVVVAVSDTIGVGIVLNGQLVRGRPAMSCGFGHVVIDEAGPQCNWGHRGCWEAFASNLAAVRYYNDLCPPRNRIKRFDELLQLIGQNDRCAVEALRQMTEYLGAGIAMLVSGFAPDFISIAGDIAHCWDNTEPMLLKAVQKRVFSNAPVKIITGVPRPPPGLQGVIALVLQNHFAAPVNL
jgi:predicted NBD/HSP70 family sugar kinase